MRWSSWGCTLVAALVVGDLGVVAQAYSTGWNFSWPTTTQQCQNVTIAISGGEPPWVVGLIPIGKAPITWRVRAPEDGANATLDNPVTATIPVQLAAGEYYTVMVTDQIGYAGGGGASVMNPTVLQRVAESTEASCLASVNSVPQEFNFVAYGNTAACGNGFKLAWQDRVGRSPYAMTVIPLDTSYNAWDVPLTGGVIQPEFVWSPNMTAGTYFTLLMTNQNGWGRGGVGQIYQVANSTTFDSCVTQPNLGKLRIPSIGIAAVNLDLPATPSFTTTIAPAVAGQSSTASANQEAAETSGSPSNIDPGPKETESDKTSDGGGGGGQGSAGEDGRRMYASRPNVGAIAGGVAGGVVAVIALGLLAWFVLCKRKRGSVDKDGYRYAPPMDINENGAGGTGGNTTVGKVEPFPAGQNGTSNVPEMSYTPHHTGQTASTSMPANMPYAPYDNRDSMPMPFPLPMPSGSRNSYAAASQTAESSAGPGYNHGSSSFGGQEQSADNPYTALKTASPPTFTSPRDSYPALGTAVGTSTSSGPADPSSPHRASGMASPSSPPLSGVSDHRASYLPEGAQGTSVPAPVQGQPPAHTGQPGQVHPHQEYNFVRHSDGGAVPQAGAEGRSDVTAVGRAETVELPPEYDDRRASAQ